MFPCLPPLPDRPRRPAANTRAYLDRVARDGVARIRCRFKKANRVGPFGPGLIGTHMRNVLKGSLRVKGTLMDNVCFRRSSSISRTSAAGLAFAFLLMAPCRTWAQASTLNQNVLVVYNSASSDSTDVANYYVARRAIPSQNLCAIKPPSTTSLSWSAFDSTVRIPIGNCLSTVG